MGYRHAIRGVSYAFDDLRTLLARASPPRSGDDLAGIAASCAAERVAAQMSLADLPLSQFLTEAVIPYEQDEVTRLIVDSHDGRGFAPLASLTTGEFRDWLLAEETSGEVLANLAPGVHAGDGCRRLQADAGAGSGVGGAQDPGRQPLPHNGRIAGTLCARLQPNHPTDDPAGIAASILDGLLLGGGDAVIGINPVSDNVERVTTLLRMVDRVRERVEIPTQSCVLAHITTQIEALERGAPVDLVFQSIAGTEETNASFGVNLALLDEAYAGWPGAAGGALSATTSCTLRPGKAARSRRMLIMASTSRPARREPTRLPASTGQCW